MTTPTIRDLDDLGRSLSSLSIWHQSKAKANRTFHDPPPETCPTHESTCRVPHETVEMIIAHLAHNLGDLKACSLTCRSWYLTAVPHIHHTVALNLSGGWHGTYRSLVEPISKLHERGLIDLVKVVQVDQEPALGWWFLPRTFTDLDLRHFSALSNVHTLKIRCLEIYRFIPDIERYFGQFRQSLRSIVLWQPYCTPQQLSHFLSLFSNLDDIAIRNAQMYTSNPLGPDVELPQFSAPTLRGRLALYGSPSTEIWTRIIASYGGIRFRHMDLRMSASCASILFRACADTLETLRLGGMRDDSAYISLSSLKVLRSLQLDVWITDWDRTPNLFSTITSPVFSELVNALASCHLPLPVTLFAALRRTNEFRHFKLVFLLMVEDPYVCEGRRELAEALDSVTIKELLDFLDSPPTIRVETPRDFKWDLLDFD